MDPADIFFRVIFALACVLAGPGLFFYLLVGYGAQEKLRRAYEHSGVDTCAFVAKLRIVIQRRGICCIEIGRNYYITFAYRAPGTGTVYLKRCYYYVPCFQRNLFNLTERFFTVACLPGQPASAVPKFLVDNRATVWSFLGQLVLSLFFSLAGFGVFASMLDDECLNSPNCRLPAAEIVLVIVLLLFGGCLAAWLIWIGKRATIPGTVVETYELPVQAVPVSFVSSTLDDQEIPIATVLSVLDDNVPPPSSAINTDVSAAEKGLEEEVVAAQGHVPTATAVNIV